MLIHSVVEPEPAGAGHFSDILAWAGEKAPQQSNNHAMYWPSIMQTATQCTDRTVVHQAHSHMMYGQTRNVWINQ